MLSKPVIRLFLFFYKCYELSYDKRHKKYIVIATIIIIIIIIIIIMTLRRRIDDAR